jgi:hypothetical protein
MDATLPALLTVVHLAAFLGVGELLRSRVRIPGAHPADRPMHVWAIGALAGYVVFWLYFADARLGLAASIIVCSAGLGQAAFGLSRWIRARSATDDELVAVLVLGVAFAMIGMLLVFPSALEPAYVANARFLAGPSLDNLFPTIFADLLWEGADPRAFPNDWLSSDRPPLQAGILLAQRPLAAMAGSVAMSDQVLGTIAQLGWIPAMWSLLSALGVARRRAVVVMLFCLTSGFFLFNSVFVWPKLLAASLAIAALVPAFRARGEARKLATWEWVATAALAALALLAHAGVAFTFLGCLALAPFFRGQASWRGIAIAVVSGLTILAPWIAYQKLYDPPGNRLVKWHLAGSRQVDDRSLGEAMRDRYRELGWKGTIERKEHNARLLARPPRSWGDPIHRREAEFFALLWTLGVLNAGWVAMAWKRGAIAGATRLACGLGVAGVAAWMLLMLEGTLVHQGSYATVMLLFAGLAAAIVEASERAAVGLLAVHAAWFALTWLVPVAGDGGGIAAHGVSWGAVLLFLVGLAVATPTLRVLARERA